MYGRWLASRAPPAWLTNTGAGGAPRHLPRKVGGGRIIGSSSLSAMEILLPLLILGLVCGTYSSLVASAKGYEAPICSLVGFSSVLWVY